MQDSLPQLLGRIRALQKRLRSENVNTLHVREYSQLVRKFRKLYKPEIESRLLEIYDEYFEDDSMESIVSYLSDEGVLVYCEDLPGFEGTLHIFLNPIRLEFVSKREDYSTCLWKAA